MLYHALRSTLCICHQVSGSNAEVPCGHPASHGGYIPEIVETKIVSPSPLHPLESDFSYIPPATIIPGFRQEVVLFECLQMSQVPKDIGLRDDRLEVRGVDEPVPPCCFQGGGGLGDPPPPCYL